MRCWHHMGGNTRFYLTLEMFPFFQNNTSFVSPTLFCPKGRSCKLRCHLLVRADHVHIATFWGLWDLQGRTKSVSEAEQLEGT